EKITLDDLANIEHLSTFYISHIIKDYTGMNFRDFLCFARVEWSEIQLLDTTKKISQIARDVGFSTTSYYEKYFKKWFGHSPREHREKFMPMVKSEFHQETLTLVTPNKAIKLIRQLLSSLNSQKNNTSLVSSLKLEIDVDIYGKPISYVNHRLNVEVTCEDFRFMGYSIFSYISQLRPEMVTVISDDEKNSGTMELKSLLEAAGFKTAIKNKDEIEYGIISSGNDSIALPICLIRKWIRSEEDWVNVTLRDQNNSDQLLAGLPSVLTSNGIRKPSYFAHQILSGIKGQLICWGKQYSVIASGTDENPFYVVLAINFNDEISDMCSRTTTIHQAKNILDDFKDELDLNVSINLPAGMYSVMKCSMLKNHNIFAYLSSLDFGNEEDFMSGSPFQIPTEPELDIYVEDVLTSFNINFAIRGAGLQIAVIRPKVDSGDVF
ncbi:MAG: helix-turn-helix domain-containing protein, partial [Emergencia sp.]